MLISNNLILTKIKYSTRNLGLVFLMVLFLIPLKVNAKENVYLNQIKKALSGKYSMSISSEFGKSLNSLRRLSLIKHFSDSQFIEFNRTDYLGSIDLTIGTNLFKDKVNLLGYEFELSYQGSLIRESDKEIIFDSKDMLSFVNQLLINYDLSENIGLKITPRFLHQNLADTKRDPKEKGYPWDMWFIGYSINYKITDNIKSRLELFNQASNNNISTGQQSGYNVGLEYNKNYRSYLISYSNFSKLSKNSVLNNLGINNNDKPLFRIQLIQHITIK